ncbi:MAG: cyanophycinase [Saprospiraceae bacterium]|nr:cyanophycinase [Saprospiraceae bacterium]
MTTMRYLQFLACSLWVCLLPVGTRAQSYTSWFNGDTSDVVTTPQQGVLLAGGGTDNDDAMRWMLHRASGGDVVIIRASGSNGYNDYLYSELGETVNSVQTIRFDGATAAQDAYVIQQIRNAKALFLAGGDQYDYYLYWKDTPVEDAINYLINEKHAVVGGTSAGMAVLSEAYYTPSGSGIMSPQALANPYHPSMNILGHGDFIINPLLANVITDTHYEQRSRKGRHVAFMARIANASGQRMYGIACNETVAVGIDEQGIAHVFGDAANDHAFFLQSSCRDTFLPEVLQPNQPLTWSIDSTAVWVCKIPGTAAGNHTFDLNDWETQTGGSWEYWSAHNGTLLIREAPGSNCLGNINAVEDFLIGKPIKVYPNPVRDFLRIENHSGSPIEALWLSDCFGRTLRNWEGIEQQLDLTDLHPGHYRLSYILKGNLYGQHVLKF